MNKKMMWEIINFLIIIGYTLMSVLSGITVGILIMHIFINISPIDSKLIPLLFVGSIGISFFATFRIWKFVNWYYFDFKAKLLWLKNPPMRIREDILNINTIEPLNPKDDWLKKEKNKKRWKL